MQLLTQGFNRAFSAIFDSNVTTLITAGVLYYFGTSSIKGFAITLSVGILASMFTAIVITRWIISAVVDRNPDRYMKYIADKGEGPWILLERDIYGSS